MTAVQIIITGENAIDAAKQYRDFMVAMQLTNAIGPEGAIAAKDEPKPAPKKIAKPAIVEDDEEEEAPKPKPKAKAVAKKPVVEDDEEDEEDDAPKKPAKKAAKQAVVDDEDEEEEAPKKSASKKTDGKTSASAEPLKDDGKEQPATVDGCRIMVRRVARAHDTDYAQAVLAEFGVDGATKVPPKKMASFIERCQEVIDDADSIELAE